jgi:LPS export ABC transporter protein LptC
MYKYILISTLFFTILSCENTTKNSDNISKNQAQVEMAKEVEILYSDTAVVRIKISAPELLSYIERDNPHDEFPKGIRIDFFDAKQQPTSTLTAKYAIRYPLKNQVIARDSCVWQSISNKEKLEGFELIWDENLQKVYSNKLTIITTPTEKIWGYGFETNRDFTHWKINKPQGRLAVDKIQ